MGHYFINDENLKSEETIIKTIVNNNHLVLTTDNGVFSKKGLDFGTRTLLETIDKLDISGSILDFGCGYGAIGIYLAKTTKCDIDMIDINKRALNLAEKNAINNNVIVNIFESDIYSNVDKKYDYIISNPPIRVGKIILYKILFEAKQYLNKNGKLIIVISKNQGAKSLVKDLESEYIVEILEKNKGFYIISAKPIDTLI